MEAIQQQSFPITDARVISEAVTPTQKEQADNFPGVCYCRPLWHYRQLGIAILREAARRVSAPTTHGRTGAGVKFPS